MLYYMSFDYGGRLNGVHFTEADATAKHRCTKKPVAAHYINENWGMFTRQGERRLAELAQQFVTRLAKGVDPQEAAKRYFRSFARLWNTKTMAEAGDTAVREAVWDFATRFSELFQYGEEQLEFEWNNKEVRR